MRVVIADDELLARKRIRKLLEPERSIHVVGEARNGKEAVTVIREQEPDLVFLDIQMPLMDGFAVVNAIGNKRLPIVVFVTAYDQYALRAFKVHALDYLLKPFDDDEFTLVLGHAKDALRGKEMQAYAERVADLLNHPLPANRREKNHRVNRFVIKDRERIYFVPAESVDWIEASGKYVVLHTGERSHLVRKTMRDVTVLLDPENFIRIHRSTIVNIGCIKELQPWARGEYRVILTTGARLISSRSSHELLEAISLSAVR